MAAAQEARIEKPCAGCMEPIHPEARICPHCRTPQQSSSLTMILSVLKWVGGITALLSLVLATTQVHYYLNESREKRSLLRELVAAAQIQQESGDYEQALALLEEAGELDPFYREARNVRVALAMKLVRTKQYWQTDTPDTVNRVLPDLVRSAAAFPGQESADINAHIAYAYILLMEAGAGTYSVEPYFKRALALDEQNVFAHAFLGYWALSIRNRTRYSKNTDPAVRFKEALAHFDRALDAGRERPFVRSLQLWSLLKFTSPPQSRVEIFQLTMDVKEGKEHLDRELRKRLIEMFDCFYHGYDAALELSRLTLARFDPRRLLEAFQWLYREDPDIHIPETPDFERYRYITAYLTRAAGDLDKARDLYRALLPQLRESSIYREFIDRELRKIMAERQG